MSRHRAATAAPVATVAAAAAAAAAWRGQKRRDVHRVLTDPAAPSLSTVGLGGRVVPARSSDGTRLHVRVHGPDGAPTVVLAHGWTCSADYWTPQLRALGDDLRLVTYDQRGHGRSDVGPDEKFSTDHLADDLDAVLTAVLRPGERAVLVGHSMGAMSIVAWAGRHPADVERRACAALLASTGVGDLMTESLVLRLPAGWRQVRALTGRLTVSSALPLLGPNPVTHRGVRYVALSPRATPAQVAFCERIVLDCPPRVRAAWGSSLSRLDLTAAVTHLAVPTTVVVGDADRLTPPVLARRLADALPALDRFVELSGVGHMSTVEAADTVDAEIRRLTSRHADREPVPA